MSIITWIGWTIQGILLPSITVTMESPMMRVLINQLGFHGPIQCVRHDRWDTDFFSALLIRQRLKMTGTLKAREEYCNCP